MDIFLETNPCIGRTILNLDDLEASLIRVKRSTRLSERDRIFSRFAVDTIPIRNWNLKSFHQVVASVVASMGQKSLSSHSGFRTSAMNALANHEHSNLTAEFQPTGLFLVGMKFQRSSPAELCGCSCHRREPC